MFFENKLLSRVKYLEVIEYIIQPMESKQEKESDRLETVRKITRLEALTALGLGFGGFIAANIRSSARLEVAPSRPKSSPFPVERSLGRYRNGHRVGLILGIHDGPTETYVQRKDFFEPVGGLFLDSIAGYFDPNFVPFVRETVIPRFVSEKKPFLSAAMRLVTEEKVPLIFGDATANQNNEWIYFINEVGRKKDVLAMITGGLAVCGVALPALMEVMKDPLEQYGPKGRSRMTRRQFLKLGICFAALCLGGQSVIYQSDKIGFEVGQKINRLITPAIVHQAAKSLVGGEPGKELLRDFGAIFGDLIHPENFHIVMRNIVWALKVHDLYKQGTVSEDKIINILAGSTHRFVSFFLKYPELGIPYFKAFNYKEVIDRFWPGQQQWVYRSFVYEHQGPGQLVDHPGLAVLVA